MEKDRVHDIDSELAAIAALGAAGSDVDGHARAVQLARSHPNDVRARVAAAYACDLVGHESDAIEHYEAAWALGGPDQDVAGFLLGFGSTLRNLGRADDAVARLAEAVAAYPDHAALRAFLALALHSAGHPALALATMLEAALAAARPDAFGRFGRALGDYQAELVASAVGEKPE